MGVLFAAGAVSGTLLTFEMGILWPGLMNTYGEIFGFPFVLEGFSFFIEAIFVGIYLFGWTRMSPRAHILCAVPMVLAGMAGTFFVVAANAWMNNPVGFDVAPDGSADERRPDRAACSPRRCRRRSSHMWIAAFMVTGFGIASVYAVGMLRGRRDRYHRMGMLIPLTVAAIFTPIQIGVGDWIANTVAELQPTKLAAMEAQYETQSAAPLSLGGYYYDDELHYALEVPYGLSLLIHHDPRRSRARARGDPGGGPAAGQRRAPGLQHDGRRRLGAAAARDGVRLRDVEAARLDREQVVPAGRRGLRDRRRCRAGDRLDHHGGRAASRGSSTGTCGPRRR